jgi:hypothetical protein
MRSIQTASSANADNFDEDVAEDLSENSCLSADDLPSMPAMDESENECNESVEAIIYNTTLSARACAAETSPDHTENEDSERDDMNIGFTVHTREWPDFGCFARFGKETFVQISLVFPYISEYHSSISRTI